MAKIKSDKDRTLRWRFDVNTFRLLGRDLITDRITAVFELVKNCYDANSTEVVVEFQNVTEKLENGKILISDNGVGMSFKDIRDKWMVVGTDSKRTRLFSDKPFNRRFVGEKGIGRFAVDKLGERLLIKTKQKEESQCLHVNINWDEYESKANSENLQLNLFTDVDNEYHYEIAPVDEQGTTLEITHLNDVWSALDLERLYKELTKLSSPFYQLNPPFEIYIKSNEIANYRNKLVKQDPVKYYSHHAEIGFNLEANTQETLQCDEKTGKIYIVNTIIKSFGPVKLKLYFFNESAKRKYNAIYKNDESRIDGVKIYRNGIIATPFAEFEGERDRKRDILGIDKRLWRDIFNRVGTREIIGILEITSEFNPKIIDATNRQDFIDNSEYRDLKAFVISQLDVFSKVKKFERSSKKTAAEIELQKAGQEVNNFSAVIDRIEKEITKDRPGLEHVLQPLKQQAYELKSTITHSLNEQKKFQKEVIRKENIYMSLMSLQDYAANLSHAIRTSLGKIKRMALFLKTRFPNPEYNETFKSFASTIYDEMNVLIKVTDFMLSYAGSNIDFEDFSLKNLIEDLLLKSYEATFEDENIKAVVEIKDEFIVNANKTFIQDIFQNLVSNSIKAVRNNNAEKIIKCSGYLDNDNFVVYFSDNGFGIEEGKEDWIFGLYNTTTADLGGAGLGLYIVEKRIEALKGTIRVVESEFYPKGATFKITLPFKRE